jgi:hypothetical protein
MSGMWKRSHGGTIEAPPNERGGNRYVLPNATAPHLDSTKMRNTRTERMFSASPPTTDMRWLHSNDRFVPGRRAGACRRHRAQAGHRSPTSATRHRRTGKARAGGAADRKSRPKAAFGGADPAGHRLVGSGWRAGSCGRTGGGAGRNGGTCRDDWVIMLRFLF